jgi:ribokinase
VQWGNAAGAIAVTRPGAQPSMPKREELIRFLKERQP